jgi:hypothetical protein
MLSIVEQVRTSHRYSNDPYDLARELDYPVVEFSLAFGPMFAGASLDNISSS